MAYDPLNDGNVAVVVLKDPTSGALYAAGSGGGGGAVTQSGTWTVQPGNTANTTPWLVSAAGPLAAAATISGNPGARLAAAMRSTKPTYADGQLVELQATPRGQSPVALGEEGSGNIALVTNAASDATAASAYGLNVQARNQLYNGTGWDRAPGNTGGMFAQGAVAHDGVDSGNPVKVGGVYKSAATAVASGDRTDFLTDAKGNQGGFIVASGGDPGSCAAVGNNQADGTANSVQRLSVANFPMKFNGTSWDRDAKPSSVSRIASAAASVNATLAKSSAGTLAWVMGMNKAAYDIHLKLYNKASSPTVGTDTVALSVPLPAGAAFYLPVGLYLGTGIAYGLTQGAADSDATALAAGDVVGFSLGYL